MLAFSIQSDSKLVQKWLDGVKDFLMKERVIQRDPEGLQKQLDQCMVSSADVQCFAPFLFCGYF